MSDAPAGPDTIRILVATDNHVGYNEQDPIRGNDSARTFDEVMHLAKKKTVDMVLLAGDLFHENKPSRKSLNAVMRSLRLNCLGDKPCELEMLSDPTEQFDPTFDHVNYEDPNINVAIPVFSIHGNHDDPSGDGHLAALDILQTCGLLNYYGRTPESDNILVKPVLLQKGRTKLALYGMSNVRDERLFRTFRDGKVKFFRPGTQKDNWFNLMSVHQNHHAYTQTGFLPENFLPEFMNIVIWGHEHECLINPRRNPETSFDVIQPGSSVATSLMPGEAVDKHVTILEVTGKDYTHHPIRLKTVRPFVMKEIVLQDEKGMKALAKKDNNRTEITRYLMGVVEELIGEARRSWKELHSQENQNEIDDDDEEDHEMPLPLVRLRVEYTAPEGGKFDCENPQRFSNRFEKKVANINDVVQFHKKKVGASRKNNAAVEMPEESRLAQTTLDSVRVEKLVREFLTAQPLTVFHHSGFGDAVSQFVDKDDKHAMELFINDTLSKSIGYILGQEVADEADVSGHMDQYRSNLEELWASGHLKRARSSRLKPKPPHWDSDLDGEWADQPGAVELVDADEESDEFGDNNEPANTASRNAASRGRGRAASGAGRGVGQPRGTAKNSTPAGARGGKKRAATQQNEDEDSDILMIDDNYDDDGTVESAPPTRNAKSAPKAASRSAKTGPSGTATKKTASQPAKSTPAATNRQTTLNFSQTGTRQSPRKASGTTKVQYEISDDEISDDDDAFEPAPSANTRSRTRR